MRIKELLIKYGVIEPPITVTEDVQRPPFQNVVSLEYLEETQAFLAKAKSRYCEACDEFFKRPHSLKMHLLSKDHAKNANQHV